MASIRHLVSRFLSPNAGNSGVTKETPRIDSAIINLMAAFVADGDQPLGLVVGVVLTDENGSGTPCATVVYRNLLLMVFNEPETTNTTVKTDVVRVSASAKATSRDI